MPFAPSLCRPLICAVALSTAPAALAETPRELLTAAAFQTSDKARALSLIGQAISAVDRILMTAPNDHEAVLQRAVAIGYRAKLTRSRADARASLGTFEALAARNPRDAEAQMVIAGWHLDAIDQLGSFVARTVLGAKEQVGEAALGRAVALGGNRAFYPGLAALMRIRADHNDVAGALALAERAANAPAPAPLDQLMKRNAAAILPALRAGNGKAAASQARKLLPFGRLAE
ncbi:hypothetical protein ACFSUK_16760 [Sphingobium scionense]